MDPGGLCFASSHLPVLNGEIIPGAPGVLVAGAHSQGDQPPVQRVPSPDGKG